MTTLTEKQHMGQFLIMSTLGDFARIEVTIAEGLVLEDGAVIAIDATDSDLGKAFNDDVAAVNTVAGILYGRVDATSGDTKGVMVGAKRGHNVVDGTLLNWADAVDATEQATAITAMESLGFIVENV